MNQKLPVLKSKELIRILLKVGFVERRKTGKHLILKHPQTGKIIPIPIHGSKDIRKGTLHNIIKEAGFTLEEFIGLK